MDESNGKAEGLYKARETEASSEVVVKDKRRKRAFFFTVAAIASFFSAGICLILSVLCFRSSKQDWVLGSLFGLASILLYVAVPVFGIMACAVPLRENLIQGGYLKVHYYGILRKPMTKFLVIPVPK